MRNILKKFHGKNIAVVGDLMLDRYIFGEARRLSPEAPVPIVALQEEEVALGGAGNTAANVSALGGKVFLISACGNDEAGKILLKLLKQKKIDTEGVLRFRRPTTEKARLVAGGQTIVRMDKERDEDLESALEKMAIKFIKSKIKFLDGIVVSDYAKGFVTKNIGKTLVALSRRYRKPLVVDTKPEHFLFFKGATVLTPNKKEAESAAGIAFKNMSDLKAGGRYLQKIALADIVITLGPQGSMLFSGKKVSHLPSEAQEVFDVTGAGDTLAAALTLSLAAGAGIYRAAKTANAAAGLAVSKKGTATVSADELANRI